MDDLCTCGHDRDEHADGGGVCLAVIGEHYGWPKYCPCDRHEPEQDDL